MNIAFKNSFLKIIKKLKDEKLRSAIVKAIANCENATDLLTVELWEYTVNIFSMSNAY